MSRGGLLAGFAAFAILMIGLLWRTPSVPAPVRVTRPNPFADPKAGEAHIRKLAEQYGDRFDRLSGDDRIFLNSIAMGHGRELLAKYARERQQGQKASAGEPVSKLPKAGPPAPDAP